MAKTAGRGCFGAGSGGACRTSPAAPRFPDALMLRRRSGEKANGFKKKKKKDATRGHYFVTQAERPEGGKTLRMSPPGGLLVVRAEPASRYWLYFLPARSHRHLSTCRCDCRFNPERGRAPVSLPPRLRVWQGERSPPAHSIWYSQRDEKGPELLC